MKTKCFNCSIRKPSKLRGAPSSEKTRPYLQESAGENLTLCSFWAFARFDCALVQSSLMRCVRLVIYIFFNLFIYSMHKCIPFFLFRRKQFTKAAKCRRKLFAIYEVDGQQPKFLASGVRVILMMMMAEWGERTKMQIDRQFEIMEKKHGFNCNIMHESVFNDAKLFLSFLPVQWL